VRKGVGGTNLDAGKLTVAEIAKERQVIVEADRPHRTSLDTFFASETKLVIHENLSGLTDG
jgi:hypothetical protein